MTLILIILGIWMLFCGIAKLAHLQSFVSIVKSTKLFNDSIARIIGVGLPILEIVLGVGALFGLPFMVVVILVKQSVSLALLLVLLFKKTPLENCGCYGNWFIRPLHWTRVIDNVVIITLCGMILVD